VKQAWVSLKIGVKISLKGMFGWPLEFA